jgi:inosine-uridine nucleoside N-ribohydrolase
LGYHVPAVPAAEEKDRAAQAILDAATTHPHLTLCCLGPLTNVAHALRLDPSLPSRTGPVFIMGGTVGVRGTQTEWSEFNWWADPESAHTVLAAGFDIRLVPLDVTRRIAIPGAAIRALRNVHDDADAHFWERALAFYADFHRSREKFDGCIVNDALAVALVADPSLADWSPMRVGVVTGTEDDRQGALVHGAPADPPAHVALGVRAAEVISLVGRTVFGRWLGEDAFRDGAAAASRWLADHPRRETHR